MGAIESGVLRQINQGGIVNKLRSSVVRYVSHIGFLITAIGLTACATQKPVVMAPPPAPPVVVQATPPDLPAAPSRSAPVQAAPKAHRLSDANVIAVMIDINNAEIREARLVLSISRNPRVRAFAQRVVADHTRLNNSMRLLSARLQITPLETPASRHLRVTERQALSKLATLRGPAFNRAYIAHQVATHQTVLNGLNRFLLPEVQHPQLRIALLQARPVITAHLQLARQLQSIIR